MTDFDIQKWEACAALTAHQQECLQKLSQLATPATGLEARPIASEQLDELAPAQAVQNIKQLYDWHHNVVRAEAAAEDAPVKKFVERVQTCAQDCTALIDNVDDALSILFKLRSHHEAFVTAAASLRQDAGALRVEQELLQEEVAAAKAALKPFSLLDEAGRMLNSPGADATVAGKVLSSLDAAETALIAAERNGVRDAGAYATRLAQQRARALGLLRTHVCGKLRSTGQHSIDQIKVCQLCICI